MAYADGVRWYRGLDAEVPSGAPARVARAYVEKAASSLELEGVELSEDARVLRWRDHRIVRFGQELGGLPVFDRQVIVRIDPRGRVQTVTTNASADMDASTRPIVSHDEALHLASEAWGMGALSRAHAELGVQPFGRGGTLIWRVDGALGLWGNRTWVDALTGEVIHRFWRVWNAQGRTFEENPVATPTPQIVTLAHLPADATALSGDWVTVYRYVSGALNNQTPAISNFTIEQTALANGDGDFLYEPTIDASQPDFHDPFAEVSVYYHLDRVYAYFRDVHGYTSSKNHVGLANYGDGEETVYDNAFFTPVGVNDYLMAMGQGTRVDLGYDGDVIYHEFGHSVIDGIAQMQTQFEMMDEWGINTGPGGIHEGLADYWAGTLTDDPMMGEYSLEGMQAGAGRDMRDRKVCPGDIWGEVHMDGEVFGSAAWAARVALGDNPRMDDIMYGSLSVQTSKATYRDFALGMLDAAAALVASGDITQTQADAMEAAMEDRGFVACGRDVTLDEGPQTNNILFNFAMVAAYMSQMQPMTCEEARTENMPYIGRPFPAIPFNFQFRKNVPASATSVSLRIEHNPGTDLEFYVYARRGQMVHFSEESVFGMLTLVEPIEYDHAFGPFTVSDQRLAIGMDSTPPLEPGADYYFAITQKHCTTVMGQPAQTVVTITGETDDTPVTPDAGVTVDASTIPPDPDPKKKGCGCAAADGSGSPAGLLMLFLLTFVAIRRRR
jgi:MYXO-CTERM domain-containing protein